MDEFVKIGYTMKSHGLKGEIKVNVDEKYEDDFEKAEVIFITVKGIVSPFFIEEIKFGSSTLLKFEDIDKPEDTLPLSSKEIFMRASDIVFAHNFIDDSSPYLKYIGYRIFDNGIDLGIILDVVDVPQQVLAILNIDDKEILIPLNDIFITKIENKTKSINMDLPEGLLSL
jgi:16S rRNA processing protein RimM